MKCFKKEDLPYVLKSIITRIEVDQNSNFVKAFKYDDNSWRIEFDSIFRNTFKFKYIEEYLTNMFDLNDTSDSCYDDCYIVSDKQIVYLKFGSIF